MKKTLLIILTALSALGLVNEAGAQVDGRLVGTFARANEAAMLGYESQDKCESDGGRWFDGDCIFGAEDSVRISVTAAGIRLAIDTVGITGNACEYEGLATYRDFSTLVSTKPARAWNGKEFVATTCEVTVTALDGGAVTVKTNGHCEMFCSARASLEIDTAHKR